ncbi:hypothetical protein JOC77_004317 [Peribacillus deserti]|uniref:Uncharacterized protein n=1 Tax=Peribacillus deserti TaxID=673318 RepID=A0ABS2QQU9_9BACI|nr:hypothetical protein [Peribacillus deserti]MBM7694838.1 hypothetical protein [Peribacillus deserti]
MLGMLINDKEVREIEYLIKREMDEILFDLKDGRIEYIVKRSMEERYQILFDLFKRVAAPKDCLLYMRTGEKGKSRSGDKKDDKKNKKKVIDS